MKETTEINQPWALTGKEIIDALGINLEGLSETVAEERLKEYGTNTFHSKEKSNPVKLFAKQFVSPLIFLLVGASIITIILGEWINTSIIIFAVLLNVSLGFYHEYHAENTLNNLKTYIKDRARVIRDGKEEEIDSSLLVPGDIIKLTYGFRVPADARIISSNNFSTDEAILTGESIPVEKNEKPVLMSALVAERKNIAHSGTLIVQGYATAVVFATGNHTEIGKIAGIVSRIDRVDTPLKKGVDKLAWVIFFLAIVIVTGIMLLGLARGEELLPMLVLAAAIAVGAVPEALPITLTIILAVGATLIASKKGIIRKLTAAETLGSATLIMTDKTGTLTMADMQLLGVYDKKELLKTSSHKEDHKKFSSIQKKILEYALYNVDITIENREEEEKKWTFRGKPFEVNIAKACLLHDVPLTAVSSLASYLVLPFNSTNKFSVSLYEDEYVIMGAPDVLLKRSKISKEDYLKLEGWINATSEDGKRLIAIATLPKGKKHKDDGITADEVTDIKFLGMLVFYDPIRPEVPSAIKNIESHGIKLVLVTGDLKGTAISLAKQLDWNVGEEEVITGTDMRELSDEELLPILPRIKIFARVTPEDKLRVGKLYQSLGEIVAMTGDGVNDAPALKAMDIGISLGSGSDVAKSAADLVLLDDNFNIISLAIDEGRKILSNIRKAIVYLMSNSLDGIFVVGGSFLFALPTPITALQIIWVNLFTGSLPALAFAFDEDFDRERYAGKDLKLIFSKEVKFLTFGVGILSSTLLFILHFFLVKFAIEPAVARTIFFVCFSSYILAIAFSFRSLHRPIFSYNIFSNPKLNWSIVIASALLVFSVTVPFMQNIFELAPMPAIWLPFIVFWLALNIALVEGAKYVFRTRLHKKRK
ncbi:MAG TPA: HAD-IC family P-type ATPase [Candidatus Paceibacterota bacterium]|nr:HAD-IC family P-type ATPase [Candidatus Paceibacterota bacterium]